MIMYSLFNKFSFYFYASSNMSSCSSLNMLSINCHINSLEIRQENISITVRVNAGNRITFLYLQSNTTLQNNRINTLTTNYEITRRLRFIPGRQLRVISYSLNLPFLCTWYGKTVWYQCLVSINGMWEKSKKSYGQFTQAVVSLYWMYCWTIIQQYMLVGDNFKVRIRYTFFSYNSKYIWNSRYTIQHSIGRLQTTKCIQYNIHHTKCELPKCWLA